MNRPGAVATLLTAIALFAPVAQGGEYALALGGEVSRGDYGGSVESTLWSFPLSLRYSGERAFGSLSIPYLVVHAPTDFVVTGDGGPGAGGAGPGAMRPGMMGDGMRRTVTGMGDLTASAGWSLWDEEGGRPWLGVRGEVKFATADADRNLGTGAEDFALELGVAKGWLNGRLGHRWLGESEGFVFRDPFFAAVGVTRFLERGGDLGLEWYGEEAIVAGGEPRQEVTLYGGYPLREGLRVDAYLFKGLTEASAELGGGAGLEFAL